MNRHSNRHTPPKGSASCVQSFDDSQFSAIRITYRISLRSSSLWEPRHPLLKVLTLLHFHRGGRESLRLESAQSYPESLTRLSNECGNDPSAGSPTETLLRLHLPLNDEV
ncbi:unnamed protein product [Ectocarpus fasciculatus]